MLKLSGGENVPPCAAVDNHRKIDDDRMAAYVGHVPVVRVLDMPEHHALDVKFAPVSSLGLRQCRYGHPHDQKQTECLSCEFHVYMHFLCHFIYALGTA